MWTAQPVKQRGRSNSGTGQQTTDRHTQAVQRRNAGEQHDQRVKDILKKWPIVWWVCKSRRFSALCGSKRGNRRSAPAAKPKKKDDQQIGADIQYILNLASVTNTNGSMEIASKKEKHAVS